MVDVAGRSIDRSTIDALLEAFGGDREFLAELVGAYVVDAPRQVTAMRAAAAADDADVLILPTHTLKSSSASLGALILADLCARLEARARAGEADGSVEAVEVIAGHVDAAVAELGEIAAIG